MFLSYFVLFFLALMIASAAVFLWFLVWTVIIGDLRGAPFVASRREKAVLMCDMARLRPGMKIIDLGSGDGTIIFEAAGRGAHAVGFEINPFLVWFSRRKARKTGIGSLVRVERRDFFSGSLPEADVIFVYLWPGTMERLGAKFLKECRPGTRIVSNAFPIRGWKSIMEKDGIYVYEILSTKS